MAFNSVSRSFNSAISRCSSFLCLWMMVLLRSVAVNFCQTHKWQKTSNNNWRNQSVIVLVKEYKTFKNISITGFWMQKNPKQHKHKCERFTSNILLDPPSNPSSLTLVSCMLGVQKVSAKMGGVPVVPCFGLLSILKLFRPGIWCTSSEAPSFFLKVSYNTNQITITLLQYYFDMSILLTVLTGVLCHRSPEASETKQKWMLDGWNYTSFKKNFFFNKDGGNVVENICLPFDQREQAEAFPRALSFVHSLFPFSITSFQLFTKICSISIISHCCYCCAELFLGHISRASR